MKERRLTDHELYTQMLHNERFVKNNKGKYLLVYGGRWTIVDQLGEVPKAVNVIGRPVTFGVIYDPNEPLPELGLE